MSLSLFSECWSLEIVCYLEFVIMSDRPKLFLIDGSSYFFRAFLDGFGFLRF